MKSRLLVGLRSCHVMATATEAATLVASTKTVRLNYDRRSKKGTCSFLALTLRQPTGPATVCDTTSDPSLMTVKSQCEFVIATELHSHRHSVVAA